MMDLSSGHAMKSSQMTTVVRKPKKIATPPMEGVTRLCIRLCPGMSKIFFFENT